MKKGLPNMPDKAKASHIERTVYVSPEVSPGDSIVWGSWRDKPTDTHWIEMRRHGDLRNISEGYYTTGIPMTIIEVATGSDYSGSLVAASNQRVLLKEYPWLVTLHGDRGTFGVAYLGKRENQNPALIEAIDALTDYPIADDSDHSELECERESEAWSESYGGERDFRKALNAYLDEIDDDHEHEVSDETIKASAIPHRHYPGALESLWDLWREGCDAFNVNGGSGYSNEQGDSIYFHVDDWIESASKPAYPTWGYHFRQAHEHMRASLATIATFSRAKE